MKASATSAADDAIGAVRARSPPISSVLRAVAEGVEDAETHDRLRGYGFELLQGWRALEGVARVGAHPPSCAATRTRRGSLTASGGVGAGRAGPRDPGRRARGADRSARRLLWTSPGSPAKTPRKQPLGVFPAAEADPHRAPQV